METRRFTTNDAGFVCRHCGLEVRPLGTSSRNHCPRCLYSLHVDVNPGDRACECGGPMRPVGVETEGRRGFVILHRCESCGAERRNRACTDAADQPDSLERLIELSASAAPGPDDRRRRRGGREGRR